MPQSELTVPDGAREGDVLHVNTPDGLAVDVAIPAGVAAGETFVFDVASARQRRCRMLMAAVRARRHRCGHASAATSTSTSTTCGHFVLYRRREQRRKLLPRTPPRRDAVIALLGATTDELPRCSPRWRRATSCVAFLDGMGDYIAARSARHRVSGLDLEQPPAVCTPTGTVRIERRHAFGWGERARLRVARRTPESGLDALRAALACSEVAAWAPLREEAVVGKRCAAEDLAFQSERRAWATSTPAAAASHDRGPVVARAADGGVKVGVSGRRSATLRRRAISVTTRGACLRVADAAEGLRHR